MQWIRKAGLEGNKSASMDTLPFYKIKLLFRMKYLARVTRLVVHVSSVQVNLEVLDRILRAGNHSDKKVLPSRRRDKENSHVSFFLKYKLPGGGDGAAETSFCSRKLKQSFVDFNARKLHPTVFNAQVGYE